MTPSQTAFVALIAATGLERLVELRLSKRNLATSLARGGVEHGLAHYPVMVVLHTGLLLGCVAEVLWLDRPLHLWLALPMITLAAASQALRWWCIRTLGSQWNTRVVIIPGASRVMAGPYRYVSHPNYIAVIVEGFALPLIHSAWVTALTFTLLNACLLAVRIRVENQALTSLTRPTP